MRRPRAKHVHLALGIFWIVIATPAVILWKDSILFVILMSIYANAEASFAAYQAAKSSRAEKK